MRISGWMSDVCSSDLRRRGDPRARRRERRSYRAGAAGRAGERVIIPPGPLKVLVATQPVDFRKGMVGLASLVERELRLDPFSAMLFIFREIGRAESRERVCQ